MSKWEVIHACSVSATERMEVLGGWIYRIGFRDAIALCFVPQPDKCIFHNEYAVKVCQKCLKERNKSCQDSK